MPFFKAEPKLDNNDNAAADEEKEPLQRKPSKEPLSRVSSSERKRTMQRTYRHQRRRNSGKSKQLGLPAAEFPAWYKRYYSRNYHLQNSEYEDYDSSSK